MTMFSLLKDKYLNVLAMLMAITLISWFMRYSLMLEPKTIGGLMLFLAFVKVQIIISRFMELNTAAPAIRLAFWSWTIAVGAMSIAMYLR